MTLLVGIDEAGYGPLLGPLCVGSVVLIADPATVAPFEQWIESGAPDLWTLLADAVCRKARDPKGRVAIDDSKKLKRPNDASGHPLEHLERGVLAWAHCLGDERCADDASLLRLLGAEPRDLPHWGGAALALPAANDAALLGIATQRLRRALAGVGLSLGALRVAALDAPEFNTAFARTRSKASVNTALALERLLVACRSFPGHDVVASFDRHGGRIHYRDDLAYTFPDSVIRVLDESEPMSRYELVDGARRVHVTWQPEAESAHLTVALASMAAKYVRELWMQRLNRYFAQILPALKPTAGYVEDGRRWLAQVEPHLQGLGLERRRLVRMA